MKRLLSFPLALSLAAGMSVVAFAAQGDIFSFESDDEIDISAGSNMAYDTRYTVSVPYSWLGRCYYNADALPNPVAYDTATIGIVADAVMAAGPSLVLTDDAEYVNVLDVRVTAGDTGWDVAFTTESQSGADSAAFSLKLTATVMGLIPSDFYADGKTPYDERAVVISGYFDSIVSGYHIIDVIGDDGSPIGEFGGIVPKGMGSGSAGIANLDIRPDAGLKMYLVSEDFLWGDADGAEYDIYHGKVTAAQLRKGKITVKKSVARGANVIEDVAFASDSGGTYVDIQFVEYFVSTSGQDVEFSVCLAKNGDKRMGTEVTVAGTMENEEETVDEGDEYISLEQGLVVEARGHVRNIQMYLGNGATITTNLFKDQKYYGVALNAVDATDSAIMDKYPSVGNVLTLKTVNLQGSGSLVTFQMDGEYYVYGADGAYLGVSGEAVAYCDKYYFSTQRIRIDGSDTDTDDLPEETAVVDAINKELAGDTKNANNPDTGFNRFVGAALAAGLLSTAVALVSARKRNKNE